MAYLSELVLGNGLPESRRSRVYRSGFEDGGSDTVCGSGEVGFYSEREETRERLTG